MKLSDDEWERIRNGHADEADGIKAVTIIDSSIQLTPEHRERIRRIAVATGRTEEQVLSDAVTEYLVRIASRKGLGPGQW